MYAKDTLWDGYGKSMSVSRDKKRYKRGNIREDIRKHSQVLLNISQYGSMF